MNEYFTIPTAGGQVVRLPFPADLPLEEREAYMAAALAAHAAPPPPSDPIPSEE